MDNPDTTTEENQASVEESIGGLDALKEAISESLNPEKPSEQKTEELPNTDPPEEALQQASDEGQEEPSSGDAQKETGWQKRINKLTAQKRELEEQLHDLRQDNLEKRKAERPAEESNISALVAQAESQEDLERLEEDAMAAERWAKRSLTRYRRDPDSVESEIQRKVGDGNMPDDVEAWLEELALNAEFSRESDIPKRRKQIDSQIKSFEFAAKKYPWLKDPQNPAKAWVDQVKQANPGIKNLPDVDLYLARSLVGFYVEQEQAAKGTKRSRSQDPTPQPGRPAATKPLVSDVEQRLKSAKDRVRKTGSRDGLKDWIKAAANI